MRLLLLTRSLERGGAERQLVVLAGALRRRGHTVKVMSFYRRGPLARDLQEADVPVVHLDKRGRWDVAGFLFRLLRTVAAEKPDAIQAYLVAPNLASAWVKLVRPGTTVLWGVRASDMDLRRYEWIDRVGFKLGRVFSRFPDAIVVNSESGRSYYEAHGYPVDRMEVIPNGIETERFRPGAADGAGPRVDWGIREGEPIVGIAARLDPMKDHPTFLRAAGVAAMKNRDIRFVCVGDGPEGYRRELEELAKECGVEDRVVWAGARDDMPAVYDAFDVATSTSVSEGFSNAVAEAMSCGTPCVVTDAGDSGRIVGDVGRVVPRRDPEALAAAWLELLEGADRPDAERVRDRIVRRYSVDLLADRTEDLLRRLGAGAPR